MFDFNQSNQIESLELRLRIGFGIVSLAFALLIARLIYLQIFQNDELTEKADNNRILIVPDAPTRGIISDRNGTVLARNYLAYTLEIAPSELEKEENKVSIEEIINRIHSLIPIQAKDRQRFKRLREERRNLQYFPIRTHLSDEEVAIISANRYQLPGVEVKARLFREYPLFETASHAVGYIGRINDKDIEKISNNNEEENYRGTDYIGKTGLEQYYEFAMHGKSGYQQVEVSATRRAVRKLYQKPSTTGKNLNLTLDLELQRIVEQEFRNRNFNGSLVAIEPSTGGILALVSMPGYDPNLFVDGISGEDWNVLNTSADKPMLNRAINGIYPPGSTFKPFMAMAALTTGKRTPNQGINDPGYFVFGNNVFRDDKKGGHGFVNMYTSIVHSCDTYYYQLANDLGIDAITKFMATLGLGSTTGIDIPNESAGVLPSQEWKKKRFKNPAQQKWIAGETISIGIGQGYNAYTPLQLAYATAILANNGIVFRPHIVREIVDPIANQRVLVEPQPIKDLNWKPEYINEIKRGLQGVITSGTASKPFAGVKYSVAGKTGTAQVYSLKGEKYVSSRLKKHLHDHALFIAFAPVEQPKIALAVVVENGGFGAESAAPIARIALDYYLQGKKPVEKIESNK